MAGAAVKEEEGNQAGAGAEEVEPWDGTVVKVEPWDGTVVQVERWDGTAAVREEEEHCGEQTELKEPAAKRRRTECQLNTRKLVKNKTDKVWYCTVLLCFPT